MWSSVTLKNHLHNWRPLHNNKKPQQQQAIMNSRTHKTSCLISIWFTLMQITYLGSLKAQTHQTDKELAVMKVDYCVALRRLCLGQKVSFDPIGKTTAKSQLVH